MRYILSNRIKLLLCITVLLVSRYLTMDYMPKEFLFYAGLSILFLLDVFSKNNIAVYCIGCVACAVGFWALFDVQRTLLFVPLFLFLILTAFGNKQSHLKEHNPSQIIQSIYMYAVEPIILLIFAAKSLKNGTLFNMFENVSFFSCCFVLFTSVLLYYFRFANLSGKSKSKGAGEKKAEQYGFLLITYLESIALSFLQHQVYYYLIIITDLWLIMIVIGFLREKEYDKMQQSMKTK